MIPLSKTPALTHSHSPSFSTPLVGTRKRRFHVVHLSSVHPADDLRIFAKEACSLARAGFHVTVVAQAHSDQVRNQVHIQALPPIQRRWRRIFRLLEIWQRLKYLRPDLLHLHDPELLLLILPLKWRYHLPVIFDAHEIVAKDIRSKYWLPTWLRPVLARLYGWLEQFLLCWSDGLVVVSEEFLPGYSRFRTKRTAVVGNFPILVERESSPTEKIAGRLVYVGRSTPIRGVEEMIRAFAMLNRKNTTLQLIGPIDERYQRRLLALTRELKVETRVRIVVTTTQEEISRALQQAQIGLVLYHPVPNHLDSLPTKAFTYMMNRLPMIASDIPKWSALIRRYRCGLVVNPYRPREIAAAIERLLEDESLRKELGNNGWRAVRERFNWQTDFPRLLHLYSDILKNSCVG